MKTDTDSEELDDEALKRYADDDFPVAFDLFSQLAKRGHASAENYLGIMYGAGLGVEKDDQKSLFYHKRAGRHSKQACYYNNIARQYEIMGNRRRALYWWNKAHTMNDKGASLQLAKRLLQNQRSDSRKRATELLQITASGVARVEVSEYEQEEAHKLLKLLGKGTTRIRIKIP